MKLYDLELSGNCYKVRLFAALTNIELEIVPVDFLAGAHKEKPVIDLNPWGELPVLVDGDIVIRDSQAILVYLARKQGGHQWWPDGAAQQAEVVEWLATAANEIAHGPNAARLVDKFGYDLDKSRSLATSSRILGLIENHLQTRQWLALERPTIAECAIFPYIALAWEGGIDVSPYAKVSAWMSRVKQLPGFVTMPGI